MRIWPGVSGLRALSGRGWRANGAKQAVVTRGGVYWIGLDKRRPCVVVSSSDVLGVDVWQTHVVPLTSNLDRGALVGNVLLDANVTGLPKDSVAVPLGLELVDRSWLDDRVGRSGGADSRSGRRDPSGSRTVNEQRLTRPLHLRRSGSQVSRGRAAGPGYRRTEPVNFAPRSGRTRIAVHVRDPDCHTRPLDCGARYNGAISGLHPGL